MYAAIAGLRTHMQNLNVIGNNVANVNTQGYKAGRSVFRSSIYTTLSGGSDGTATVGGRNPSQIGYGSNLGSVSIDMSTGNLAVTGKSTDMMIDGDGFFLVGNKDIAQNFQGNESDVSTLTSLTLTRTGDFEFGADGYFADSKGNVVYGFLCVGIADEAYVQSAAGKASGAKVGDPIFSDQLVPLRQPRVWKDTEGGMHVGYPRPAGGIQEGKGKPGDADYVPTDADAQKYKGNLPNDAKLDDPHLLDYGSYKDGQGNVVESGYSKASLMNITIDNATGIITASCGDLGNQIITIGCVAVGSVDNPNGVTQIGNSYYQAGQGSGKLVINTLEQELGGLGIGTWTTPKGGYFISFDSLEGCAKAIVAKAKKAGVVMTGAGATYPYGKDPHDSNIRIAPTYPSLEDLRTAMKIFTLCVKLVAIDKLLSSAPEA